MRERERETEIVAPKCIIILNHTVTIFFLYLNEHVMFCGQRREKTAVRGHAKVCDCVFAFVWVCLLAEQVASKDMMGPLSDDTDGELEGWRRMLYAYNNSWSIFPFHLPCCAYICRG